MVCEYCGVDYAQSFDDGTTYCFACNRKSGIANPVTKQEARPVGFRTLSLDRQVLTPHDMRKLWKGWGIPAHVALKNGFERGSDSKRTWLVLPVYTWEGKLAHESYRIWEGWWPRKYNAATAPEEGTLWLSWLRPRKPKFIAIVEGVLDGVFVSQILPSVALLGTELSQAKLTQLRRVTNEAVAFIMLDPDAYKKSLTVAERYGILKSRVIRLDKDPTEYKLDELKKKVRDAWQSKKN